MARTDTLGHFLTDVADAIRTKTGSSDTITASDFDTEIENIPSGVDLSEYFTTVLSAGTSNSSGFASLVKKLPSEITVAGTTLNKAFCYFKGTEIPVFDSSNVSDFNYCFSWCQNLTSLPNIDFSNGTSFVQFAEYCSSITTIPDLHLVSKSANFTYAFRNCTNLENFPFIDLSGHTYTAYTQNMVKDCPNLTDTSLDNLLKMCITLANANGAKTLAYIGLNSTDYPVARIQALSHYQDFIDAGWTIGY